MNKRNASKKYTMGQREHEMANQFPYFNLNSNSNSSNSQTSQTLKNLINPNYKGPWSALHPYFKEQLIKKYKNKSINDILKNNTYSLSIRNGIIKGIEKSEKKNKSPKTKKSPPKPTKSPPKTKKSTKKPLTKSQILQIKLRAVRNKHK